MEDNKNHLVLLIEIRKIYNGAATNIMHGIPRKRNMTYSIKNWSSFEVRIIKTVDYRPEKPHILV